MNKEKNISLIKKFFDKVYTQFSNAFLCLEIKDYSNTYIVEVTPKDIYDDDNYISMEIDLRSEFEKANDSTSIVFVSEDSYVRVNPANIALCIPNILQEGDDSAKIILEPNKDIKIKNNHLTLFYNDRYQNNYPLAA